MAVQNKLYTATDLWEISQQPENADKRFELIEGIIYEVAPSSPANSVVAARFVRWLGNFVEELDLGFVTGADGGFRVSVRDVYLPDAAFISKARLPDLPQKEFPIAPDLAVEVVSPSETSRKVLDKVQGYLKAGTRMVLAVYIEDRVLDVYRLLKNGQMSVETLRVGDTFDGADVLPGFHLALADLFKGLPLQPSA